MTDVKLLDDAVTYAIDRIDQTKGVDEDAVRVQHMGAILDEKLTTIFTSDYRRKGNKHGFTLYAFTQQEVDLMLWLASNISQSGASLVESVNDIRGHLVKNQNKFSEPQL